MKDFLNQSRHKIGSLIFDIKYKLGIAKEGRDFITVEQPIPLPTEFRCCICQSRNDCPAYETGVIFPCPYFKEERNGQE